MDAAHIFLFNVDRVFHRCKHIKHALNAASCRPRHACIAREPPNADIDNCTASAARSAERRAALESPPVGDRSN